MKYDSKFFDYVDSGALRSADIIIAWLFPQLKPKSVLDVGCGRGGWLKKWRENGCSLVRGVDGDYVDLGSLYILREEFCPKNISEPFDLGRRFDVVQCLEVAEHVEPASSQVLVDNLIRHSDVVFFSAAVPGQGGTQHINERPLEYWRELFLSRGYDAFDCVRPKHCNDERIEPWYRYNAVVYANKIGRSQLPPEFLAAELMHSGAKFSRVEPLSWRLRTAVIRFLPVTFVDRLASLNAVLRKYGTGSKGAA